MERQKRWQFFLILAVIILTLINILPTVFYYTKPLSQPIDAKRAENVAEAIVERVNNSNRILRIGYIHSVNCSESLQKYRTQKRRSGSFCSLFLEPKGCPTL